MEAVEDKVGGNNCALAQKIATEHPDTPGKNIVSLVPGLVIFNRCVWFSLVPNALTPPPVCDHF